MAITKGAKKATRSSARKRVYNVRRKRVLHDAVQDLKKQLQAGKSDEARNLVPAAYKAIDKAAKRGVIKAHTAARKKSRLMASIKRTEEKKK
jgi:ribosomal protein S20